MKATEIGGGKVDETVTFTLTVYAGVRIISAPSASTAYTAVEG